MIKESTLSLVVLAAGLGTRFGGNKQLEQFSNKNLSLMECNICHAIDAGFIQVIFVIRPELKILFDKQIVPKFKGKIDVSFVYQSLSDLPDNTEISKNRVKPLGTAHAIWCCRKIIKNNFVVINADDYYGQSAFTLLKKQNDITPKDYAMVAYQLDKTLSDFGHVNRGFCQYSANFILKSIKECTNIYKENDTIMGHIEHSSASISTHSTVLDANSLTSMNCWLFSIDIFKRLDNFIQTTFNQKNVSLTTECYLPSAVMFEIESFDRKVHVLTSQNQWFGLTYQDDIPLVEKNIQQLADSQQFSTLTTHSRNQTELMTPF